MISGGIIFLILMVAACYIVFAVITKRYHRTITNTRIAAILTILLLLSVTSSITQRSYTIERMWGEKGPSEYHASISGIPFQFFEITDTEVCSSCDDIRYALLPLIGNIILWYFVTSIVLYIIPEKIFTHWYVGLGIHIILLLLILKILFIQYIIWT